MAEESNGKVWSLGDAMSLGVCELLMSVVDPESAKPDPQVGESVTDYWLRVVRYQAWDRGCGAGEDYASRRASEDPDDWPDGVPVNPHSSITVSQQP